MGSIWEVLGLEQTQDVSAIRRAYAQKAKVCHPEEDPEGFLELRKAYQAALKYAESGAGGAKEPDFRGSGTAAGRQETEKSEIAPRETEMSGTAAGESESGGAGQDAENLDFGGSAGAGERGASGREYEEGWTLAGSPKQDAGSNPYIDHQAIRSFLELYTGRQRKDSRRWLDYFTSDAFLDAAWDRHFTALLLEHVTSLEKEYPVNREFLNWLCVAYQFTVKRQVYLNPDHTERTEFQFQMHPYSRPRF